MAQDDDRIPPIVLLSVKSQRHLHNYILDIGKLQIMGANKENLFGIRIHCRFSAAYISYVCILDTYIEHFEI